MYSQRRQRGRHRAAAAEAALPRRARARDEGVLPDDARADTAAGSRASTSSPRSTRRSTRLGMDYVDLYQIHRWDPRHADRGDDGRAARRRARRQGALHRREQHVRVAVRQGAAGRRAPRLDASSSRCRTTTTSLYREEEREMIPQCVDQGVGVIPWSPLARGLLAGTRTREGERRTTRAETDAFGDRLYGRPEDFDVIDRLAEVAAERGEPPAQVALAWLLAQARRDRADRRRDEARAPRGRARRGRARAVGRGDRAPRGAVPAPPGARPRVMIPVCHARRSTAPS